MGDKITETRETIIKDDSLPMAGERVVKVEKVLKRPVVTETKTTIITDDED